MYHIQCIAHDRYICCPGRTSQVKIQWYCMHRCTVCLSPLYSSYGTVVVLLYPTSNCFCPDFDVRRPPIPRSPDPPMKIRLLISSLIDPTESSNALQLKLAGEDTAVHSVACTFNRNHEYFTYGTTCK